MIKSFEKVKDFDNKSVMSDVRENSLTTLRGKNFSLKFFNCKDEPESILVKEILNRCQAKIESKEEADFYIVEQH